VQFTIEYAHDILSLFNIVPLDRNVLGPAILQSQYAIVEELFLIRGAHNIIVVSEFPFFHVFFSFRNK